MNNTYGIIKPSLINVENDVEIWYHYKPTRATQDESFKSFKRIDPSSVLKSSEIDINDKDINNTTSEVRLPGMYDLSLPASIFNKVGIYTVYIKPKEIYCSIKDVGALTAYPDVAGIVIDIESIESKYRSLFENDGLVGYRVEYFNNNERQNFYRIVTSNNRCEAMSQNLVNANVNSNGYRFNGSSSLCFLTLTPSTSPSFKSSTKPYIGVPSQKIVLSNTNFDPVCLEIEICNVDFDTINTTLNGNQIRSLDNSLITTYNENGEIFQQFEYYDLKNNYNTNDMLQVKKNKEGNINFNIDYEGAMNP